jgi:hypothetical protein
MPRRRRTWLRGATAAVVMALGVVFASSSVLASGPTGDPATIALFKSVASNTNLQPAIRIVQSGYMSVSSRVGASRTFSYRWGYGKVPAGSVRATETITYVQLHGRVVWLTDVLAPNVAKCQAGSPCPRVAPIELFVTKAAAFAGLITGPHDAVACFEHKPFTDVPYRAGGPWWSAVGEFRPKATRGNQTIVTITYSWADGQHVAEIDSIDNARRLFVASSFHVARGATAGEVAFGFSQHDTALPYAPLAPNVTRCR